mmetsp:Transcript_55808/g.129989  ORF Transcript_55808/g.129989 Transcript_55808/m.129989 type:complete len:219 (-) Transcript_55808:13-669(-)
MEVLVLLMQEVPRTASSRQGRRRLGAWSLIDHKIEWHAATTVRLAHMHKLEAFLVEVRKEGVALDVLRYPREVQPLATWHRKRLLVGSLATHDEELCDVVAGGQELHSGCHGGCHQNTCWERRLEARIFRGPREHHVDAPCQRPELLRDRLPRLAPHDHGVGPPALRSRCYSLEVCQVLRDAPGQLAILANAVVQGCGDDHGQSRRGHGGRSQYRATH